MLPTIFTAQARKTSVSRDASDHFHRKSFQNDRFVRGFLEISQHKLPKRSFRARLPRNFKEQASKKIVSCEASSKFHSKSSQNERFARCFRPFSQKKLPKRSFRARLRRNFTAQASKKIVSCEASSKFHRTILQNERFVRFHNERFVRGFLEISQKKLPKRAFRARLPRNFTEQASKTNVLCEASSKFHRTSFQNKRFVRGFLEISQNKLPKRAFRARPPPKRAFRARLPPRFVRFHRTKLPKRTFRAMLPTISIENLRFATVSCHRPTESYERVHPAKAKCASRYNGVPFHISKSTFYYSGVRKNV